MPPLRPPLREGRGAAKLRQNNGSVPVARLPPLHFDDMNEDQRRVAGDIQSSRGTVRGPFEVWLQSPELAQRAQQLGMFSRYNTSLPKRLSELAILLTARQWTAQFEWAVHVNEARKAGLAEPIIAAIQAGEPPADLAEDEALLVDFVAELYATRKMSQPTYERAVAAFSVKGVVELVGILGYYALISMTLNVFDCDTPDGTIPLAQLD